MRSFATAMELAESDEEMFDTLMQIITVGLCLKGNVTNCRYMYVHVGVTLMFFL